ncbi:MAG: dicarboxylate/amino acid:cation symporter [Methylotenera sp.]|nr:dicarboxylate/amino acid:cation symporter [Methylotenera sp.]MDO9233986.1 dicarboxylate/amino acid:cation symporter [Methylotenera sp.]MDO9390018.1 dicarboxylate/amino acid:cation symporter [Methylotenera sp.]MDP2402317.1 dicarboxylate/amino acid:cation symporter [Methylotenera sp.]MDP3095696.1 dicarboxylate/amino acid:cation symporter [Methylotenera sp.]
MKLPSLNIQILLGTIFGVAIGLYFNELGADHTVVKSGLYASGLIGTLFIDLLKMILIPLVLCSISVGIANLRQHQQMHRVWVSAMLFFVITMMIAISLALIAGNYFKPGSGLQITMFENSMQNFEAKQLPLPEFFAQFLHGLFVNPFTALAQNNVLAVVMFALILGITLVMGGERFNQVRTLLQEALDITMLIVGWIMYLAPLGIMALLIKLVAAQDIVMLGILAKFVAVVVGTTLLHGIVVLPLILYLFTAKSPLWFLRGAREALLTAFATSSSAATLPITMRCTTQHLHVKPEIAGFVLPLGATVNMDGTALYEAAAALFVANLVGIELSFVQQLVVFFIAMIAAMGAPGIPSAGMVTMVMVLQSVGLPAEAIAILLPIDRLLDTLRTTVNVEGDMVGSLVVQKLTLHNANEPVN